MNQGDEDDEFVGDELGEGVVLFEVVTHAAVEYEEGSDCDDDEDGFGDGDGDVGIFESFGERALGSLHGFADGEGDSSGQGELEDADPDYLRE